jgi:hypothetical protein
MTYKFGRFGLVAIAGCSAMLLASCENKVAQCNKIIGVANKATTEVQKTSQDKSAKIDQLGIMAGSLDTYAKEMGAIEVKDEKLKGFQGRFVQMYQQMSASSKSLIDAAKQKKAAAAQTALAELKKSVVLEQPLVNEVNQYCQAK